MAMPGRPMVDRAALRRIDAGRLERAVRPFAERPPQWRLGRPEPEQDDAEPVLEWAARTCIQVMHPSVVNFQIEGFDDIEEEEVERITREERVENPQDPEQFVDVEVIEEVTFRDPETGRRRRVVLDN